MIRLLGLAFAAIVLMTVLAAGFSGMSAKPSAPPVTMASHAPRKGHSAADELVLARDESGRFHVDAQINGEEASFLLDTGADTVALTLEDAMRLGLDVDRDAFQPIAQTASGVGYGAPVQIPRIEIAGQEFRDVDAVVIDGLSVNLLGRSLISRMGTLEMQGERMVIRRS